MIALFMIVKSHPWLTASAVYLALVWGGAAYCMMTASKTHEESL